MQTTVKTSVNFQLFPLKVLAVYKKAIPLHPLSNSNGVSSKCERCGAKQEADRNKSSLKRFT
ncbi:hypothetical protein DW060_02825 [Leyella stercorea]|uniref:Uncharacterized protein n=1 Tax=Leyella stercorea TaxID=363265 RepID=A0A3R6JDK7_9BACT|nr:hypothetical protein DW060_02825 [Leyella stercorea]